MLTGMSGGTSTMQGQGGAEQPRDLLHRGSNQSGMRAYNERLVLSLVRRNGALSKSEIARMTGLSAQTVSVIMRQLEAEGLLMRGDPVRGKVGQPQVPMSLNPSGALFFGLKVGRRSADLVLVDFLGKILHRTRRTYRYPDPDETLVFATSSINEIMTRLTAGECERISGLGIALPGFLWEWARQVGVAPEDIDAWRERDIRADLAETFEFPVYLQNDASCACGAELVFGAQERPAHFVYFYIGHFVGGGIVLNNELFTGPLGNAGAIGPLPVPGGDGALLQLVDVASLAGLEGEMKAAGADSELLWRSTDSWDIDSGILERWLDEAAESLAYALTATCSVIDFELAIVDGWLPDTVRSALIARMRRFLPRFNWAGLFVPEIREGGLGADARSLGAASLPLSNRFLVHQRVY